MIFVYIICGLLFLGLSIYFLDKREKISNNIKEINRNKKDIEDMNKQLDDLQNELDELNAPLMTLNKFSKKALKFFSK